MRSINTRSLKKADSQKHNVTVPLQTVGLFALE